MKKALYLGGSLFFSAGFAFKEASIPLFFVIFGVCIIGLAIVLNLEN